MSLRAHWLAIAALGLLAGCGSAGAPGEGQTTVPPKADPTSLFAQCGAFDLAALSKATGSTFTHVEPYLTDVSLMCVFSDQPGRPSETTTTLTLAKATRDNRRPAKSLEEMARESPSPVMYTVKGGSGITFGHRTDAESETGELVLGDQHWHVDWQRAAPVPADAPDRRSRSQGIFDLIASTPGATEPLLASAVRDDDDNPCHAIATDDVERIVGSKVAADPFWGHQEANCQWGREPLVRLDRSWLPFAQQKAENRKDPIAPKFDDVPEVGPGAWVNWSPEGGLTRGGFAVNGTTWEMELLGGADGRKERDRAVG